MPLIVLPDPLMLIIEYVHDMEYLQLLVYMLLREVEPQILKQLLQIFFGKFFH